ncbi:MAG: extracellular solute-binding protein [Lachnospiraceae bacterium]|nr:extracellular solute-binding protein [Lachnospiraceae bacterium]
MMKALHNRKIIAAAVLLFLLLVAGGLYDAGTGPVVLEFGMFTGSNWNVANANSFLIIDEAIARFEAAHPGVKVHYYSGVPREEYSEWLSRKILAGEEPDVFMVLGSDFDQFSSIGIMKNLDELIGQDADFDAEKYFQSALNTGKYGDAQYALPYETVPTLMFVNQTLLTKEGIEIPDADWNWDEMYDICRRVTRDLDGDGILDQFGICNYDWLDAVYSNGGEIFQADGKTCYLAEDSVVEAVKYIRQLNELYQGQKVAQDDFNGGNVAFMPLTFAEYRTYKTYPYKIKRYANFKWDCITMPAGKAGGNVSQVDTLLMGISANTRKEELAWEFLKLLTYDEEIQTQIFSHSQGASVLRAVTQSAEMEAIVQAEMEEGETVISGKLLGKVIEEGYTAPQFKKYEQALALSDSEIGEILENDKTIDSNMKILQRTINSYLQQ